MQLARFPRIRLGHFPTPIEPMPKLSRHLGGPNLFIKRDDCSGLAGGGNKARPLEFLMAEAVAKAADIVITHGALQSNHARQTAAAAAKLGLHCILLFERRVVDVDEDYEESGNVLLNRLYGAEIAATVPAGSVMTTLLAELESEWRARGRNPYLVPGGGSNPLGALGHVNCALELLQQNQSYNLQLDQIVVATSSAGTQAGLSVGLRGANSNISITGISISTPGRQQEERVYELARATRELAGCSAAIERSSIVVDDSFIKHGYGVPTPEIIRAVKLVARMEGILLDPVYTGKAMAGLISLIEAGKFGRGENVLFVHTGGAPALFGYRRILGKD